MSSYVNKYDDRDAGNIHDIIVEPKYNEQNKLHWIGQRVTELEFGKYKSFVLREMRDKLDTLRKSNGVTALVAKEIDPTKKEEIYTELSEALKYLLPIQAYLEQQLMGTTMKQKMSNFLRRVDKEYVRQQKKDITEIIDTIERIKPFYSENVNTQEVDESVKNEIMKGYESYVNKVPINPAIDKYYSNALGGRSKSRKNAKRNKRRKTIRRRRPSKK